MASRSRIKDFFWRHSAGIAFLVMVCFVGFLAYVGYTYVIITKKFDATRRWDLPSRIYSDATPLVPRITIPRTLLEPKLNHVGYHEAGNRIANPGEYRFVGGDLEIYLQNFEYPDVEFRALAVRVDCHGIAVRAVKRLDELDRVLIRQRFEERFSAPRMARDYLQIYQRLAAALTGASSSAANASR